MCWWHFECPYILLSCTVLCREFRLISFLFVIVSRCVVWGWFPQNLCTEIVYIAFGAMNVASTACNRNKNHIAYKSRQLNGTHKAPNTKFKHKKKNEKHTKQKCESICGANSNLNFISNECRSVAYFLSVGDGACSCQCTYEYEIKVTLIKCWHRHCRVFCITFNCSYNQIWICHKRIIG